jgi:hypothetical protein
MFHFWTANTRRAGALLSVGFWLCAAQTAQAQPDDAMTRPYGMDDTSYSEPFYAAGRDNSGVRIVVNGRPVDLQDRSGGYAGGYAPGRWTRPGRADASTGVTLPRPTLAATAVGNSVSVSNVSNTTLFVQMQNNGNQISTANGRRY